MAANPYTQQLKSFTSGISNARRGLTDLYKLRTKGVESHYNYASKLYGSAVNATNKSYGASQKALTGFEGEGFRNVAAGGYQTDQADVASAVRGIIGQGVRPYKDYLKSEQGALQNWYKGYKAGEHYEDKTLKTGLKRERPAALSELEQGIVDTQTNLQAQGDAFAAQQAYNQQLQGYMQSSLNFQRQMAQGQQGGSSTSGGTGKETPNTLSWLNYAKSKWGVTVGGWRAHGSVPGSDHPHGRAIDVMASGNLGQTVAMDFVHNASQRGVKYVIWNREIWTPSGGWKRYNGPNPHTDHAHISFLY
jgi:hypothetical protein